MDMMTMNEVTMSSIEIAKLTGKEHKNVRRTMETLRDKGLIQLSQIEIVKDNQSLSPNNSTKVYRVGKLHKNVLADIDNMLK